MSLQDEPSAWRAAAEGDRGWSMRSAATEVPGPNVTAGRDATSPSRRTPRLRRRGDLVRLAIALLMLVATSLAAHQSEPTVVETNLFRLINQLPPAAGPPLLGLMQFGALGVVPAMAAIAALRRRAHLARLLLLGGGAAWVTARLLQVIVDQEPPEVVLGHVTLHGAVTPGLAFPASHVAVAAVLATVSGPYLSRANRRLAWWGVLTVGVARVYMGAHFPLDAVGGVAVGWAVGCIINLAVGVPRGLKGPSEVAALLGEAGVSLRELSVVDERDGTVLYRGGGSPGLAVKVLGRDRPGSDWLYRAWQLVAFRQHAGYEMRRPEQVVEHEALVLLLAERAGVRVPGVVTTVAAGDGGAVLVREWIEGTTLDALPADQLSDSVVADAWSQLEALHRAGLAAGHIGVRDLVCDDNARIWITSLDHGEHTTSLEQVDGDRAALCVELGLRAGPVRSARHAAAALDREELTRMLSGLQPLLLPPATRRRAVQAGLLVDLRRAVAAEAGVDPPPVELPLRVATRNLLPLLAALLAITVLLPQVGHARATLDAVRHAHWQWVAVIVAASAATYLAAAVALMGAAGRRMDLGQTWAAQVAAAFTNRLVPAGLGGMGTNIRYLEAAGMQRPAAVAAVALNSMAGFVVHVVAVAAMVPFLRGPAVQFHFSGDALPDQWPLLVATVILLAAAGLLRWGATIRRRVFDVARQAVSAIVSTLRRPSAAAALFGGSAAITAGYVLAFAAAAHAFGITTSFTGVAGVYLGASALAAAAPTPGGLGALEAGLVAGLTAAGAPAAPAVAAVLTYRVFTFWLPVLPGYLAFRALRRNGVL